MKFSSICLKVFFGKKWEFQRSLVSIELSHPFGSGEPLSPLRFDHRGGGEVRSFQVEGSHASALTGGAQRRIFWGG